MEKKNNSHKSKLSFFKRIKKRVQKIKSLSKLLVLSQSGKETFQEQILELEKKLPIKTKISISILVVLISLVPMVTMSLHYLNVMLRKIDVIAQKDIQIVDIAQEIKVNILLAKKAENSLALNLIPEADSINIVQNKNAVEDIIYLVNQVFTESEDDTLMNQLEMLTKQYRRKFNNFLKLREQNDSYEISKNINQSFLGIKNDLQQRYISLINKAFSENKTSSSDSLIQEVNALLNSYSLDDLILQSNSVDAPEFMEVKKELSAIVDEIILKAERLGDWGRKKLQVHRDELALFTARAKRNVLTIIMITFMVSIYLIFIFPVRIVKPISTISSMIRRAEAGDFDVAVQSTSSDEIGQLAQFFNQMMKQVRRYDRLKTEKIAQQQKKVEGIVSLVREGVLILNHAREITVINKQVYEWLSWPPEFLYKPLAKVDSIGELRRIVDSMTGAKTNSLERDIKMKTEDEKIIPMHAGIHVLRKENGEIFNTIIIIDPIRREHHRKDIRKKYPKSEDNIRQNNGTKSDRSEKK